MYLIARKVDGYIRGKNGNKYLISVSTDKKQKVLKNTQNFGMGLKIWFKK